MHPTADLTPLQKRAFRETGVAMSHTEAHAHLLAQLSLEQLRTLAETTKPAIRSDRPMPTHITAATFAAPSGSYYDTGADALDSNFATLRDLPAEQRTLTSLEAEAMAATDRELHEFLANVWRSVWTRAALVAIAAAAVLALTGCGGTDHAHTTTPDLCPAIAYAADCTATTTTTTPRG